MHAALTCVNVEYGGLLGLVSRAVFKTVERLLESLVCSIRTAFRQRLPLNTPRLSHGRRGREQRSGNANARPRPDSVFMS